MKKQTRNTSRRALLLLSPADGGDRAASVSGATLCGFQRSIVVERAADALLVMAAGPTIAMTPFNAERVGGMRIERALHAANASVPLVMYGPPVSAGVLHRMLAAGVTTYLDEPLTAERIATLLESVCALIDPLAEAVRAAVGETDLKSVMRFVRLTMCAEALERMRGSRRGAARLLGVDRRAVQKLVEQLHDYDPTIRQGGIGYMG